MNLHVALTVRDVQTVERKLLMKQVLKQIKDSLDLLSREYHVTITNSAEWSSDDEAEAAGD